MLHMHCTNILRTGVKGREYGQCGVNPYSHVFKLKYGTEILKARDMKQLLK